MSCSTNDVARVLQERIWDTLMKNQPREAFFQVVSEFVFAASPGILYLVESVHKEKSTFPVMLTFVTPVIFAASDVFVSKRLMPIRLSRTFFVGQIMSLLFVLLSYNESVTDYLKSTSPTYLFSIILTFTMFLFSIYYRYSELRVFKHPSIKSKCKRI